VQLCTEFAFDVDEIFVINLWRKNNLCIRL
jgi:hypothetical protein